MSNLFQLLGGYRASPASGTPSGDPLVEAPLSEAMYLRNELAISVDVSDDNPKTVNFGGLAGAHVIVIRSNGGKVRARLTSADGATQAVPVDAIFIVMSTTVPFTALDLTRVAGSGSTLTCKVFLGERA